MFKGREFDIITSWYTAADIIYTLNGLNTDNSYMVIDPIDGEDTLQSMQTVSNALDILLTLNKPVAIPINLGNNHWVALVLTKDKDGKFIALYADSLNDSINEDLPLIKALKSHDIEIINHSNNEQTNDYDCGPLTVINLHYLAATKALPNRENVNIEEEIKRQRLELEELEAMYGYDEYNESFKQSSKKLIELYNRYLELVGSFFPTTLKPKEKSYDTIKDSFYVKRIDKTLSEYNSHLEALNSLSKAFSTLPYTAIVECSETLDSRKPLYISLSDENILTYSSIMSISKKLIEVINNPKDLDAKVNLFKEMYELHNAQIDTLINLEIQELEKLTDEKKVEVLDYLKYLEDLFNHAVELDNKFFRDFVKRNFEEFLTDRELNNINSEKLLEKIIAGNFEIVDQQYGKGLHVESKALVSARKKNPEVKSFNVGLASSKIKIPFCCVCCTLEKELLEKNNITINVSGISKNNFPRGYYRPSPNVTDHPEIFLEFLKKLNMVLKYNPKNLIIKDEELYDKSLDSLNEIIEELKEINLMSNKILNSVKKIGNEEKNKEKLVRDTTILSELLEVQTKQIDEDIELIKIKTEDAEIKSKILKKMSENQERLAEKRLNNLKELEKLPTEIEKLNKDLESISIEIKKNNDELKKINEKIEKNKELLSNQKKTNILLRDKMRKAGAKNPQKELEKYKASLSTIQSAKKKAEELLLKNNEEEKTLNLELEKIKILLRQIITVGIDYEKELRSLKEKNSELKEKLTKLQSDKEEAKKLQYEIIEISERESQLNEKIKLNNQNKDDIYKKNNELTNTINVLNKHKVKLEDDIKYNDTQEKLVLKLINASQLMDKKASAAKSIEVQAEEERNRLTLLIKKLQKDQKVLNNSINKLKKAQQDYKGENSKIEKQIKDNDKKQKQLPSQITQLQEEARELKEKLEILTRENNRLAIKIKLNRDKYNRVSIIENDILRNFLLQNNDKIKILKFCYYAKTQAEKGMLATSADKKWSKSLEKKEVKLISERSLKEDYSKNVENLRLAIEKNNISSNTIIVLEKRQRGSSLRIENIILLANIIAYNKNHPNNKIVLPENIQDLPIFAYAQLYNAAQKKGIKIIEIMEKDPLVYNETTKEDIASMIIDLTKAGYQVIFLAKPYQVKRLAEKLKLHNIEVNVALNEEHDKTDLSTIGGRGK